MSAYTVHQPLISAPDPLAQADQLRFVKEGFSWLALLFPFVWLIFHRMWLVLAIYVAVVTGLELLSSFVGLSETMLGLIAIGVSFILAAEANNFRRWTLERAGYRMIAAVSGRNLEICELKFFSSWSPEMRTGALAEHGIPGTLAATADLGRSYAGAGRPGRTESGWPIFGGSKP